MTDKTRRAIDHMRRSYHVVFRGNFISLVETAFLLSRLEPGCQAVRNVIQSIRDRHHMVFYDYQEAAQRSLYRRGLMSECRAQEYEEKRQRMLVSRFGYDRVSQFRVHQPSTGVTCV